MFINKQLLITPHTELWCLCFTGTAVAEVQVSVFLCFSSEFLLAQQTNTSQSFNDLTSDWFYTQWAVSIFTRARISQTNWECNVAENNFLFSIFQRATSWRMEQRDRNWILPVWTSVFYSCTSCKLCSPGLSHKLNLKQYMCYTWSIFFQIKYTFLI